MELKYEKNVELHESIQIVQNPLVPFLYYVDKCECNKNIIAVTMLHTEKAYLKHGKSLYPNFIFGIRERPKKNYNHFWSSFEIV